MPWLGCWARLEQGRAGLLVGLDSYWSDVTVTFIDYHLTLEIITDKTRACQLSRGN